MKAKFDKKNKAIKYIPECDNDVFRLGRMVQMFDGGWGAYEFVNGKMSYVSFNAIDMINCIFNNARPNQSKS
jgi:hypothetical protein